MSGDRGCGGVGTFKLTELEPKKVPEGPGVYVVCWVRGSSEVEIPRILGVDTAGILYVGSAKNLRRRLRALKNYLQSCLRGASRGARGGEPRYRRPKHTLVLSLIYTGLYRVLSEEELVVHYKSFRCKNEARMQEALILYEYSRRYGEPPPLNLSVGRQFFMILDLGELNRSRLAGEPDSELLAVLRLGDRESSGQ